MICPRCASHVLDGWRYCPKCGHSTESPEPASSGPADRAQGAAPAESAAAEHAQTAAPERTTTVEPAPAAGAEIGDGAAHSAVPGATVALAGGVDALLTEANLFRLRGMWNDAVEQCLAVLRTQPGNQAAHSLLGDVYRDQNKLDEAIQWYRMAYDLRPNTTDAAKLQEQERKRSELRSAVPEPAMRPPDFGAPASAAAVAAPRRKLTRGAIGAIAAVAVALLAVIVFMATRHNPASPSTQSLETMPPVGSITGVPPTIPGTGSPEGSRAGAAQQAGKPSEQASLFSQAPGLPPDRDVAPHTGTARHGRAGSKGESASGNGLGEPAPALFLTGANPQEMTAFAQPVAEVLISPPESQANSRLPAGMTIAAVQRSTSPGTLNVTVTVPMARLRTLNPASARRARIVRNMYEAARQVLSANADASSVRVTIYVETSGPAQMPNLLIAMGDLNRNEAMSAAAEIDPVTVLQTRMASLNWGPAAPPSSP